MGQTKLANFLSLGSLDGQPPFQSGFFDQVIALLNYKVYNELKKFFSPKI